MNYHRWTFPNTLIVIRKVLGGACADAWLCWSDELGDPVQRVHVEAGRGAVFIYEREWRKIGVDAVDVNLLRRSGRSTAK